MEDRTHLESSRSQTTSPLAALWSLIGGVILLIGLIAGLIASWQTFVSGANTVVSILIYLAMVVIPAAVVGAMVLAVRAARRREKLEALDVQRQTLDVERQQRELDVLEDQNRRQGEAHAVEMELRRRTITFDGQANAALIHPFTGEIVQLQGQMRHFPHLHTFHHAPRNEARVSEERHDAGQLPPPERPLPKVELFYELIPSNSLQVGLGIEALTGTPVLAPITRSTHFKFIGGSGSGKSCLSAALLDIATTTNDPDRLKIGLLDLEYNTSRLFEHLPHIAEIGPRRIRLIGRNPDEVAEKLKLLQWELTRRAQLGEEYCREREPLLLVYVEELLALKYEVVNEKLKKEMLAAINILGVRARKYGLFLLACMQSDYSDKSTREAMAQFRTRGGFAIDPDVARASGFFNTALVKQNFLAGRPGQYVLEKPSYCGIVLAPEYDVASKLDHLGGATTRSTMRVTTSGGKNLLERLPNQPYEVESSLSEVGPKVPTTGALQAHLVPPLSPQEWRIVTKWRQGMGLKAIIASEFTNTKGEPLTGGDLFTHKARDIQALIARFLPAPPGQP